MIRNPTSPLVDAPGALRAALFRALPLAVAVALMPPLLVWAVDGRDWLAAALTSAVLVLATMTALLARATLLVDQSARRERALLDAHMSEQIQTASRAKTEFLANMSHELRTPMTAILGFAESLMDPALPEADRLAAIMTIQRNGEHLLSLINDILDISKIESGKFVAERQRCSPIHLLADVMSLMRVRAVAKCLDVSVQFGSPIPETIETDPTRLRQVLINLVGNAIKFTESGAVWITVSLLEPPDAAALLRFDVVDSGIGIAEEEVERLFLPFHQADGSTTRRHGGTGLGLSISRQLAQMLGGDIEVRSVPGLGSMFRATIGTGDLTGIRLIQSPELTLQQTAVKSQTREVVQLKAGTRVLLAEDGRDNQRLISFLLQRAGAEVALVESGAAAVAEIDAASAAGRAFDLVLMDMQMPEMDGYTATRLLRGRGHQLPVLALTAHAMPGDREKCIEAGCTDYLRKPIDRTRLLSMIRRLLELSLA